MTGHMDTSSESTENTAGAAVPGEGADADEQQDGTSPGDKGRNESTPLTGTSTSADEAEPSYAGAGTPDDGDVQEDPGSQVTG